MCACLVTQSCLTLCDLLDCSPPGSSVHGNSLGKNTGVGCHLLLQEMNRLYIYIYIFQQNVFEIHPCCCMIKTSFLFLAKERSTVWMYHILLIHSSVDGHLDCFQFLPVMSNSHTGLCVDICFHFSLWVGIAGSWCIYVYLFTGMAELSSTLAAPFQFPSATGQDSGFSISHPRLAWSVFLMKVILVGV